MKSTTSNRWPRFTVASCLILLLCYGGSVNVLRASSWNGIEPFKSRRADVLQILGKPVAESSSGTLRFNVAGGTVWVSFVDEKFVTTKKLRSEVVGTVLEVVLQHASSSDTPESMRLLKDRAFVRDDIQNGSVFRNPKEGIVYTFLDGKLRTTRFTFSEAQFSHARRSGKLR